MKIRPVTAKLFMQLDGQTDRCDKDKLLFAIL